MRCPTCGTDGSEAGQACPHCGAVPQIPCDRCGFVNQATARFCGGCGRSTALSESFDSDPLAFIQSRVPAALAERILRSSNTMLGERKHVTILFADVRDSTALVDKVDPEHALAIIAPVIKVLMEAVHQNDGFVNQTRGDGIMAMFGAPLANEEHAVRACYAALAMREGVRALRRETGTEIDIRIGLNSGEVVIHSIGNDLAMNYDAAGKTTHLAARMEQVAEPGAILVTAATFEQAKGFVDAKPKGLQTVRGIQDPVEVFELRGPLARTRWQVRAERGLSELTGRAAERAFLKEAYESAADGRGSVIRLIGAPGVGKSRLVHDFIRLDVGGDWRVFETAC